MNTDAVCGALSVCHDSEILMISSKGQTVRCPVLNIRETNRGSKGVKLVNLNDGDKLIGISEVIELDEESSSELEIAEDSGENEVSSLSSVDSTEGEDSIDPDSVVDEEIEEEPDPESDSEPTDDEK